MLIETDFDSPLENDIVFEETDETQGFEDILKNSENMYKAVLYLRRMFSNASSPSIVEIDRTFEDGQVEFVVQNEIFYSALIFIEGIKVKQSEYTIENYINDTVITFTNTRAAGSWLNIVIFR